MAVPDDGLIHLVFGLLLAAITGATGTAIAVIAYFLRSERDRVNKHIEDHDKTSGEHQEDIVRLQEQQAHTKGWLEAIDERMKDGFKALSDKLDRFMERRDQA